MNLHLDLSLLLCADRVSTFCRRFLLLHLCTSMIGSMEQGFQGSRIRVLLFYLSSSTQSYLTLTSSRLTLNENPLFLFSTLPPVPPSIRFQSLLFDCSVASICLTPAIFFLFFVGFSTSALKKQSFYVYVRFQLQTAL